MIVGLKELQDIYKMREIARITRILALICKIWQKYPDWRLGQLLVNVYSPMEQNLFFIEDDILEKALNVFVK